MILYELTENGARINGMRSFDDQAVIPAVVDGHEVVELSPYAFSAEKRFKPQGIWWNDTESGGIMGEAPDLSGPRLKKITLPLSLKKIGNYAFYNCGGLEVFQCGSGLGDLGFGVFTGCGRLKEIIIDQWAGNSSCLTEMLSELSQLLTVTLCHQDGTSRLVLPEYFEESVENTPARILFTQMHGCGHRYRYCFTRSGIHYREYDSLFPHMKVQEPEETVMGLAWNRLYYPYELSGEAEKLYLEYLRKHWKVGVKLLLEAYEEAALARFLELIEPGEEMFLWMAAEAGKGGDARPFSQIMDYGRKNVARKRKEFELQ